MSFLASKEQLRASLMRWSLFLIPLIFLLGYLSGQLGDANSAWFRGLEKPSLFPPPYLFGIVWSVLYVMIGFSVALIASAWGAYGRGMALGLFAFHFIFNLAWTPVFFGSQSIVGGLVVLGLVVVTLIPVILVFFQVRRIAGILLVPYLAWVLFASVLNYQFWAANPDGGENIPIPAQRIEI